MDLGRGGGYGVGDTNIQTTARDKARPTKIIKTFNQIVANVERVHILFS